LYLKTKANAYEFMKKRGVVAYIKGTIQPIGKFCRRAQSS